MNDPLPWLTLVLAFLGSVLGGAGAQWISHRLQRQQAREDRRRQALIGLQNAMQEHFIAASKGFIQRAQHFDRAGEWLPFVPDASSLDADRPSAYATDLITRLDDNELTRLVGQCIQAYKDALVYAQSPAEADRAMKHAQALHQQTLERIGTLLAQIP